MRCFTGNLWRPLSTDCLWSYFLVFVTRCAVQFCMRRSFILSVWSNMTPRFLKNCLNDIDTSQTCTTTLSVTEMETAGWCYLQNIHFIFFEFQEPAAKPRSNFRNARIQFCKWFRSARQEGMCRGQTVDIQKQQTPCGTPKVVPIAAEMASRIATDC